MNAVNPTALNAALSQAPAAAQTPTGGAPSATDAASAAQILQALLKPASGFTAAPAQSSAPVSLTPPQPNVVIPFRSIYGGDSAGSLTPTVTAASPVISNPSALSGAGPASDAPPPVTPASPVAPQATPTLTTLTVAPQATMTTPTPSAPAPLAPALSPTAQAANVQARQSLLANITAEELAQLSPDEQAGLPGMSLAELQTLMGQKKQAQHTEVVTLLSTLIKMEHDALMAIIQNIR